MVRLVNAKSITACQKELTVFRHFSKFLFLNFPSFRILHATKSSGAGTQKFKPT